jgi:hypothetical protein
MFQAPTPEVAPTLKVVPPSPNADGSVSTAQMGWRVPVPETQPKREQQNQVPPHLADQGAYEQHLNEQYYGQSTPVVGVSGNVPAVHVETIRNPLVEAINLPSFEAMRPASREIKTYQDPQYGVSLRESSTGDHQDGVAYNPNNCTLVVCDTAGGIGPRGEAKNNFGFAMAHAVATMDNIFDLHKPEKVGEVVEIAKGILNHLGTPVQTSETNLRGMNSDKAMGTTVAAVQQTPEGTWRIATFGDSSVIILNKEGQAKDGYGEAWDHGKKGEFESDGTVVDAPMNSYISIFRETLGAAVRYGDADFGVRYGEVTLEPGEKIVVASDAYLQKTPISVLEQDANMTNEEWKARMPLYGDDTTIAIIG